MRSYKSLILFIFLPIILLIIAFYNITNVINHESEYDINESESESYINESDMNYILYNSSIYTESTVSESYNNSECNNLICDNMLTSGDNYEINQELNTKILISTILTFIKNKNIHCLNVLKCDYIKLHYRKSVPNIAYSNQKVRTIQVFFSLNMIWTQGFLNTSNITGFTLEDNDIKNVSFLNDFSNLQYLDISTNPINNLNELILPKLEKLCLQNIVNAINTRDLNKFNNLSALDLSNDLHIQDLNMLYIQYLQMLYLDRCDIKNDITFLNKFKHLQLLDLSFNYELNSDSFSHIYIHSLYDLNLNDCNITDTGFIYNFKKLSILNLSKNKNLEFHNITNTNLQKLYLRDINITYVSIINNFENLLTLDLSENKNILDLYMLNITSLRRLYLNDCNIKDINYINNINNLNLIDLSNNNIDNNSDKLKKFNCNSSSLYYIEKDCNDRRGILFNY